MRKIYGLAFAVSAFLCLVSCAKAIVEPEHQLEGDYVDASSSLVSEYISFRGGRRTSYYAGKSRIFAENSIWNSAGTEFKNVKSQKYCIVEGGMYVEGRLVGDVVVNGDNLTIGKSTYKALKSFETACYPVISVDKEFVLPYNAHRGSVPVTVENSIPEGKLTVEGAPQWLSDFTFEEGVLNFDVAETASDRETVITLHYTEAEDCALTLKQQTSTFIRLTASEGKWNYTKQSASIDVEIENPIVGSVLSASTTADWISNLAVSGKKLLFNLEENTTTQDRTAQITLSYSGAADVTYRVTQTGIPVTALSLNKTTLSLVAGNTETLVATVTPSDAELTWSSDRPEIASVDDDGKVMAIGAGSATVSVISGGKIATCSVTVNRATPTFSISTTIMSLDAGETGEIQITSDSDCTFTASSSNTSVATVSVSGKSINVKGVADGTATITVNCPQTGKYSAASPLTCSCTVEDRVNLSANGTANCYIVPTVGKYKFKATVKGNSTTSVGTPASASVLWESYGTSTTPSVGSIVKSVTLSGGYVNFETPSTLADGNAVIAVKNSSGTILWSWHIWVCKDYDPVATAQVYNNNAGTMMDRNLGATSAAPGNVRALGLLYQWGRKDPFLSGNSISSNTQAASTLTWPAAVSSNSSNGTKNYAVQHPTTFIKYNSSNYDWYYTGSTSTDNTRWQTSKGVYDPCPPGWRVPDGGSSGVWAKAFGTSSYWRTSSNWNSTNKGMNFGSTDKKLGSGTIWYPAAGCLGNRDGSLYDVGDYGLYWSCTPDGNYACYLHFYYGGSVSPSVNYTRASGRSVRCLLDNME